MNKKRITYAILPFIFMAIILFITYFGNQFYAEAMDVEGVDYSYVFLGFNEWVPFWAWTIYPYIIAYPFWMLAFFVVAYYSKEHFYEILAVTIVTFIICGLWYFFFQSDVESWRITSGLFANGEYLVPRDDLNFTEKIVFMIYQAAGPRNALPSMHTLMSWIAIIGVRIDKKMPIGWKVFIWIISMAIIISTQTLKQHYIIDLLVAVALAEAGYWILRKSKITYWLRDFFTKLNQKHNLDWDGTIE
ncbi:MAG: phosphatase PAP2 family protein [Bacilli bacterium]|nr:phosphatase PAP2 family protein [Bacilli bacterium]MBN2876792.1 phosphatase PAP2 family protein [Bacilli bacterium]